MTTKLEKAVKAQNKSSKPYVQPIYGILGIPINGKKAVEVPHRNSYVYVRLRNNQNEVIQAFNNKVAATYNLPVILERSGSRYVITSVDTQRYENNWTSNAPYLPRHGNTHSFDFESGGGGDIVFVHSRQFVPLLGFPSGTDTSPNLIIAPYTLENLDGSWRQVGGTGTASLIPHNPASGTQARMVLSYLDVNSGNPYYLTGPLFSSAITGTAQVMPYIPSLTDPSTQIPIAAIRLVSGTSQVSWDSIYDVRQFFHATPAGGGATGTPSYDSTYLRLDATNTPVTDQLTIVNNNNGNGGIYAQTIGDAYTADFEQFTVDDDISASTPNILVVQETDGIGDIPSPAIEIWRAETASGQISGDIIHAYHNGADTFIVDKEGNVTNSGYHTPGSLSDASAPNNSIYYSTDAAKLVYKDSVGSVHNLY